MRRFRYIRFTSALLVASSCAHASICRVSPEGQGTGTTWSTPMSLPSALADPSCTELWLRAGVYKPVQPLNPDNPTLTERAISFVIRPGVRLYGGFAGHESQRGQRDPWQHRSVLSGDIDNDDDTDAWGIVQSAEGNRYSNSFHVVVMDGGTSAGPLGRDTLLDGVTITAGRALGDSSLNRNSGGGLLCLAGNTGQSCSPTLRDVQFSGNVGLRGGAMHHRGNTGGRSEPLLERVLFSGNRSTSHGGALYSDGTQAGNAGAVMRDVRFTGNLANNYGGAIYLDATNGGDASPTIERVQFSGNNGSRGGAVYIDAGSGGRARPGLVNTTFHGNTASGEGGAVYIYTGISGDGRAWLRHVTFSGNSAARGGAIATAGGTSNPAGANPELDGVILWGNSASQAGAQMYNQQAQPVIRHGIVEGGCPEGAQCTSVSAGNPLLGPLADNGGWTLSMKPGTGSPAIDAAATGTCPPDDQRGIPRAQGTLCDIGAVEVEVPPCHVRADASGSNDGSDWANAFTSLQAALAHPACGEIRVAAGLYTPAAAGSPEIAFNVRPGQRLYGGFAGHETSLQQRDPAANRTVLSGDIDGNDLTDADGILVRTADRRGENSHRVLVLDGATAAGPILATTVVDGFAITAAATFDLNGGGLYCRGQGAGNECSPTLSNLFFSANFAAEGGGLFNDGGYGGVASPTLANITFRGNSASYGGGGMYNEGWQGGDSSPTLTNVTFLGNSFTALVNSGGLGGNSSPWLNHVTFSGNVSRSGGSSVMNMAVNGTAEPVFSNVIAWGGTLALPDEPDCEVEICNVHASPVFIASVVAGGCPGGAQCGPGVIDADPLLSPLAYTGGATPTLLPAVASAAVDAGDPSTCADRDQRGVSRPQGAACDIGAVELRPGGEDALFADGFEPD